MNSGLLLYLLIALSTAVASFLGTDEAAKYIEPEQLFWARGANTILGSVALTIKGYISPGFQDWLRKKSAGNTEFISKNTGP